MFQRALGLYGTHACVGCQTRTRSYMTNQRVVDRVNHGKRCGTVKIVSAPRFG